ncbi:MAG TPA: alkaline phosphatase family protein [Solirubrobacteraceae bacterium]|jgi:phospholipase C
MRRPATVTAIVFLLLGCCAAPALAAAPAAPEGIHKIQHVVMVMQENRSFDSYFGTYPGANGIPAGVCLPNPSTGKCVPPYHDANDKNFGGPHGEVAARRDINNGAMNGFVATRVGGEKNCAPNDPNCSPCEPGKGGGAQRCDDVMGYHDAREIPNYWAYAQNFVLQDNMFESAASWSLPEHQFLVSGWATSCPAADANPLDCSGTPPLRPPNANTTNAWTDITSLLYKAHVSWRYYVMEGPQPDCQQDEALSCGKVKQTAKTPGIWNPLRDFTDVKQDGQLENIQPLPQLYNAVQQSTGCGLPNVSWVAPNGGRSEHPPALVSVGQTYVTTLVNAIMRSGCWGSTAIFLSWDDWGGFYDHVLPPNIDENGYGLRVPGLVISPYAKAGYIDHQQLSHDAYLKFIQDDFLSGARLNPATDGRADRRPDVREEAPGLGNIANDFNFSQQPRQPLLLYAHPAPGPPSEAPKAASGAPAAATTPAPAPTTQTAAAVSTTVNDCEFEAGTSALYQSSVPCGPAREAHEHPVAAAAKRAGRGG